MSSAPNFHVVPDALRMNSRFLAQASDAWASAHQKLKDQQLSSDDVGLLARQVDLHRDYNEALQACLDLLSKGTENLETAHRALKQVADDYESKDAEAYTKLGYIADDG